MYRYYNANPLGNNIADCTIRAISLAEGESWDVTYNKLSDLAQDRGEMLDSVDFIEWYLDKNYPRVKHYSKTIEEFTKEYPKGIYLCTMPGHIVCIINGLVYDTFDCTQRKMWGSWKVE